MLTSALLAASVLCYPCLAAEGERFDPPAPEWLLQAETFNGCYFRPYPDMVETVFPKFPCIVGGLWGDWTVQRLHERGIRVIPYIDFVQSPWPEMGGPKDYTITFEGHADWIRVDKEGGYIPTFYTPNKGWYQGCFNAGGFAEACLEKVRQAMEGGIDGLFFDDCGSAQAECFGPQFGKHEHEHPDWDNLQAMEQFMLQARQIVKSYGDDKIVMMNTWRPSLRWQACCDCQMWEAFINGSNRGREYNLADMRYIASHWADYADSGKRIVALAYCGSTTGDAKEDAYFSYVWARLLGFPWADWFTLWDKPGMELYDVKLGPYLEKLQDQGNVMYRTCERGLLVATAQDGPQAATLSLPESFAHERLTDLYSGELLSVENHTIRVSLPDRAGRVYVATPADT